MNIDTTLLEAMICEFEKYSEIERVALFGSRARGDNTERSDYDIAIYGELTQRERVSLRCAFNEDLPTLHKIDIIFMQEQKPSAFTDNIVNEGVIIYDKIGK